MKIDLLKVKKMANFWLSKFCKICSIQGSVTYSHQTDWAQVEICLLGSNSNKPFPFYMFRDLRIDLTGNPLVCDVNLCWAKSSIYETSITITVSQASCAAPQQLTDKTWNEINVANLACIGRLY